MDRKTVQEWKKQDERRTYGEDRFPGLAAMQISPFTRLENLQTRLSIRSSFVKPSTSRERERKREKGGWYTVPLFWCIHQVFNPTS